MMLGQLPDELAATIRRHLEQCPTCWSALDQCVASDEFCAAARATGRAPSDPTKTLDLPVELLRGAVSTFVRSSDRTLPEKKARPLSIAEVQRLLSPPQSADEIGRLGDFRVLRVLGVGGFAVVFEAEDSHLKRHVALKVMHPGIAARQGAERFMREAQSAAALKHENIVTIHQVARHGETPFIALELLHGETLENYLIRNDPLRTAEVVRIGGEIASGLAAAHRRGLLHRDIKPANIWLESETPGRAGKVKILDFGCAKSWEVESEISDPGLLIGTPGYMAPEQLAGGVVDPRADLFGLGCVLYRMVTGTRPFRGDSLLSVVQSLALDEPKPIRSINGQVPQALCDLISELLAKSPGDRPASAQVVAERLQAIERSIAGQQDNGALPASVPMASPRRWKRKSWFVAAGAALTVSLLLVYFFFQNRTATKSGEGALALEDSSAAVSQTFGPPKHPSSSSAGGTAGSQAPQPRASPDSNRRAALWILSQGGSVTVRIDHVAKLIEVVPGHALPGTDFELTSVRLQGATVTDADLEHFRGLKSLAVLALSGKQIKGSGFANLEGLTGLKTLILSNTSVTDNALTHLQSLVTLESLLLDGTQVTDAGLVNLKDLKHLHELNLNWTRVTDAGLAQLESLTQLDNLWLGGTRATESGLAHLRGLTKLRIMNLTSLPVTDAGLARLYTLKNLQHLVLDRTHVTDAGLVSLKMFPKLYSLYLGETGVTDAGLAHLRDLPNLRVLGLYGLKGVSDSAVPTLARLRNLEEVDLRGTRLSIKGLGALKAAAPSVRITWSEPNVLTARAILAAGGYIAVRLEQSGMERYVKAIGDLPSESFQITQARLVGSRAVLDELLAALGSPSIKALAALNLSGTAIGDADLERLKPLAGLQQLNLEHTRITDAGLASLKGLTAMQVLVLDGDAIRGPGLLHLRELSELTELRIGCPDLTQTFLVDLAGLKKLDRLSLTGSSFSDEGVAHLAPLTQLKELDLRGTQVTNAGVKKLHTSLPKCRIISAIEASRLATP
jgi:serine/threonine protein kinase/Leucine-rich repeat (LRR) protein